MPLRLTPLNQRRLANFRANRRGYWSLWIFTVLFVVSLFAELIANDRPLLVATTATSISRSCEPIRRPTFGGFFETEADYRDPGRAGADPREGLDALAADPLQLRHAWSAICPGPAPSPPTWQNWLGTDDQARDVPRG